MNILDRYVVLLFLRVLGWAVLAFTIVFVLVDLFDHLDNFIDDEASTISILKYYMYKLPWVVDICLPIGMLLASLFTIGVLSKNNEYTAALSGGVSLFRLTRSILVLALMVTGFAMVFREAVVPEANRRLHDLKEHEIKGKPRAELKGRTNFTYMGEGGRVYVVSRFRPRPPRLEGLSIQTFADSVMVGRVDATIARWVDDAWLLEKGTSRSFEDGRERVERFETLALDAPETPQDFARRRVDPEDMNYRELSRFAAKVRRSGGDPTRYRAEMAYKASFPLVNFLLVVLGLALGGSRRRITLWAGFGITVLLAFLYYLMMDFGLVLAKGGAVPPWLGAWTGNIVYGSVGLLAFIRANR